MGWKSEIPIFFQRTTYRRREIYWSCSHLYYASISSSSLIHLLSSWRLSSHLFLSAGRQGIYQCCRGPRNQPRRTEVEICTEFKTPEHAKELYLIGRLRTGFVNAKVESSLDQCETLAAVEGGCIYKTKGKLSRTCPLSMEMLHWMERKNRKVLRRRLANVKITDGPV